jgi:tetratricopeptide (TPR) repeat protein
MEWGAQGQSPAQQAASLVHAGWRMMEVRRFSYAADLFGRALSISPHNASALGALASANAELGKFAAAEQAAKAGVAANPGSAWNHYVLGWVLSAAGKNRRAIKSLNTAVSMEPLTHRFWAERAFCWYRLADYVGAREDAEEAVRLAPESPDALNILGLALFYSGVRNKGLQTLRRCRELHPADARTHANLGWCQSSAGDHHEAFLSFRRALELRPDEPDWISPLIKSARLRLWWYRALRAVSRHVLTMALTIVIGGLVVLMLVAGADAAELQEQIPWFAWSGVAMVLSGVLALTLVRPLLGSAVGCMDPELNRFTSRESKDAGTAAALLLFFHPVLMIVSVAIGSAGLAWLSVIAIPGLFAVAATQRPANDRRPFEIVAAIMVTAWFIVGAVGGPTRTWTIIGSIAIGAIAIRLERLRRGLIPRAGGPSLH